MDFLLNFKKSDFVHKIKSYINPTLNTRDFAFYIYKIKKIAPLSLTLKGESFFKDSLPHYLSEIQINTQDLSENIFYLPLFFKKYQEKYCVEDYFLELLDYEITIFQIQNDPTPNRIKGLYSSLSTIVYSNPIAQALRLKFDIFGYVQKPQGQPLEKQNLLLISKNSETKEITYLAGTLYHAAILDELSEGSMITKDLVTHLQEKFPDIAQREWIVSLKQLKDHFIVLES